MLCYDILCECYAMLCYVVLCYDNTISAEVCYVMRMICYANATLHCVMLSYAVLYAMLMLMQFYGNANVILMLGYAMVMLMLCHAIAMLIQPGI